MQQSKKTCVALYLKDEYKQLVVEAHFDWRAPNSLRDSNVSPKLKAAEEQRIGATPWLAAFKGIEGHAIAPGWD
jgi:hypothetical protein